jgi:hypothetical protein
MTVTSMIVCNSKGMTEEYKIVHKSDRDEVKTSSLIGEIITVSGDPFKFYALHEIPRSTRNITQTIKIDGVDTPVSVSLPNAQTSNDDTPRVQIVMPRGGQESGLFRPPRIGEKVLVGTEDDDLYLIGYIPTSADGQNKFSPAGTDKKAEVFRYNNNGVNFSDTAYSEIGFYHNPKESFPGVDDGVPLDTLRINSTGNIAAYAANAFSLSADSVTVKVGGAAKNNASISVDSEGNITIKSQGSITFKTGRTSLSLSDSGFSVSSKVVDTVLQNTWDAKLSLASQTGFSASGMYCKINAVRQASMSDKLGGAISVNMGVGKMAGRELMMSNYNAGEFAFLNLVADMEYIQNIAAFASAEDISGRALDLAGGEDLLTAEDEANSAAEQAYKDLRDARVAYDKWQAAEKQSAQDKGVLKQEAITVYNAAKASEAKRKEKVLAYYDMVQGIRQGWVYAQNRADGTKIAVTWVNFLKKHLKALYDLYGDWKDLRENLAKYKAEKLAKARAKAYATAGFTVKTQADIEAAAKEAMKKIGENWDELSDKEKKNAIEMEKKRIQDAEDQAYEEKLRADNKDNAHKAAVEESYRIMAASKMDIEDYDELDANTKAGVQEYIDDDQTSADQRKDLEKWNEEELQDKYVKEHQDKIASDSEKEELDDTGGVKELHPKASSQPGNQQGQQQQGQGNQPPPPPSVPPGNQQGNP